MSNTIEGNLHERLGAVETQLTKLSHDLERMSTSLDHLVKAQVMMGSLMETQHTADQHSLIDAISNEVVTKMTHQLGQEASLLSDQLVGAIGTALAKRDAVELAEEAAREKPIDIMWTALSQFQPYAEKR